MGIPALLLWWRWGRNGHASSFSCTPHVRFLLPHVGPSDFTDWWSDPDLDLERQEPWSVSLC